MRFAVSIALGAVVVGWAAWSAHGADNGLILPDPPDVYDPGAVDSSLYEEWFPGNIFHLRPLRVCPAWCDDTEPFVRHFNVREVPPAALAQEEYLLTAGQPLTVVFPRSNGSFSGWVDRRIFDFQADGTDLELNSYHFTGGLWNAAVTATVYGPTEYCIPIGPLPAGDYELAVNWHQVSLDAYEGFNPAAYEPNEAARTQMITFSVYSPDAVIPEPTGLALLVGSGLVVLGRRRRCVQIGQSQHRRKWSRT